MSHDEHIYCSSCTEFDTCCKHHVIQWNLWSHSPLCCTFYIDVSAYVCYNTHMSFFVAVQHGSFYICKSLFSVILPFLVCCFLVRSMCWYQVSMYSFFHSFCTYQTCNKGFSANCIVTLVTYDVLCVIFYHLTHNCILSIFCFVKD